MKNIILIAVVAVSVSIYSCKKKNHEHEMEPCNQVCCSSSGLQTNYLNYSCLKVGNYWVYQRFEIDSVGGAERPLAIIDSCYIQKDTLINGNTFYKYVSPSLIHSQMPESVSYLRDSLSYVVTSNGAIIFSSSSFNTVFSSNYQIPQPSDTLCYFKNKMTDQSMVFNTPYGSFVTLNYRETYTMYPGYDGGGKIRYRNTRYAENVGKVIEGFYFFANTPKYWERRLIRYHLN